MIKHTSRTKILAETRGRTKLSGSRVNSLDHASSDLAGGLTGIYSYCIHHFLAGHWWLLPLEMEWNFENTFQRFSQKDVMLVYFPR